MAIRLQSCGTMLKLCNLTIVLEMAYEITITINEEKASAESILSACNYLSEALDTMQIAHTIQCQKEGMILGKITKPLKG